MGCDIHAHLEINWDGEWLYYAPVSIRRNYELFGRMAGVRADEPEPLVEQRGFPAYASQMTRIHHTQWGRDAHSESWLGFDELTRLLEEFGPILPDLGRWDFTYLEEFPGLYLFGNSITGWRKWPGEYPNELRSIRLVFWFDN